MTEREKERVIVVGEILNLSYQIRRKERKKKKRKEKGDVSVCRRQVTQREDTSAEPEVVQ